MRRRGASMASAAIVNEDVVAPVKGITKALETGTKLTKRISKLAIANSAAQATQNLHNSLEQTALAINNAYGDNVRSCGEPFTRALVEDQSILGRLKEIRFALLECIDECQDLAEEPALFDHAATNNVHKQSLQCRSECIAIFNSVREQIVQADSQRFREERPLRDDRLHLSSMVAYDTNLRLPTPPPNRPLPPIPPTEQTEPTPFQRPDSEVLAPPLLPPKFVETTPPTHNHSSPEGRAHAAAVDAPPGPFGRNPSPTEPLQLSSASEPARFIPKDVVNIRLNSNDEFLERRRQAKQQFYTEMRTSSASIDEDRASQAYSDGYMSSPLFGDASIVASPVDGRSSRASGNGYDTLMTRKRSQGQASQGTRSSRTSSLLGDRPRGDRYESQDSIFGLRSAPLTPPLSEPRMSGSPQWNPPIPNNFPSGIAEGLEVVSKVDFDNGLMLVNENEITHRTPTTSMTSVDNPMQHDSSFYKFGGFCEGAKGLIKKETSFKMVKKPAGQFSASISAKCSKCSYEVGWREYEKDQTLDRGGIYGNNGIRWRQRFISKCHLKSGSIEEPMYACIFCIKEHKTVEEHDATVFFSVSTLFRHLAKHSRPVPEVDGIITLYGAQPPTALDFDIHFPTNETIPALFNMAELAPKTTVRPSAYAIVTHPKNQRSTARDPEGYPLLRFAAGARIVGIAFPDRFKGEWCTGYHDGERGSFPTSAIMLEKPAREDVLMSAQSSLVARAKWDFKPKEGKDGSWLKFSKGDKISAIGYAFQDQWCWSGQTSKGRWGLFPAAFVENLQDGGKFMASSGGSIKSPKNGGMGSILGARMPSFAQLKSGKASHSHSNSNDATHPRPLTANNGAGKGAGPGASVPPPHQRPLTAGNGVGASVPPSQFPMLDHAPPMPTIPQIQQAVGLQKPPVPRKDEVRSQEERWRGAGRTASQPWGETGGYGGVEQQDRERMYAHMGERRDGRAQSQPYR